MTGRILLAAMDAISLPTPAAAGDPAPTPAPQETPRHPGAFRELLDALEVADTPVYQRNTLQLRYEWTAKPAGASTGEITAGRLLTETKTASLAVEHETPLDPVAARGVVMMVGAMLSHFFSW